jgi:acetate kinase
MSTPARCVLTINAGSSSIRFAIYDGATLRLCSGGVLDRVDTAGMRLTVDDADGRRASQRLRGTGNRAAIGALLDWLDRQPTLPVIAAVGHRVVHGMKHSAPARVTPHLLAELHRITPYAPDHLPREIALIEAFNARFPKLPQVACFDTAFHRTMPQVARRLPIPRRYTAKGVERYGFHGLSYAYLMQELARTDPAAARGRVILAHLGNGASLAAVRNGASIDTSMAFTPAAGLVMSSRSGDLDPGVAYYLARTERMTSRQFQHMVNQQSGLVGISGTTSDMRDLLAAEATDPRAADAVETFCYQAKKWLGSFAAALAGVDTLVFAGGIGENAPTIRKRICDGLGFSASSWTRGAIAPMRR